jgi:hypothetical protein
MQSVKIKNLVTMAGGFVYIVLFYLPEKIFLLGFKYALNGWTWRVWGVGVGVQTDTGQVSNEPHCIENSGHKGD